MLVYQDFFPAVVSSGLLSKEYESLPQLVQRANEWIASSGVKVVTVETVVLPNVGREGDSSVMAIRTSGEMSSFWFQIVRIWFETGQARNTNV